MDTAADTTPWDELRERFRKPVRPIFMAAGVYRLYDTAGGLLYIGLGSMPYYRWKKHARKASWWSSVDHGRTKVEWFRYYSDAEAAETLAIRTERPRYNIKDSTSRMHWTQEKHRPSAFDVADRGVVTVAELSANATEIVTAVRALRRCVLVAKRRKQVAAILPVELAQAVMRVGGPDVAAKLLSDWVAKQADA